MAIDPAKVPIFHITQIENLRYVIEMGRLLSDAAMIEGGHQTHAIGDNTIKFRRLHEIRTDCPPNRYVGEFVPFYYCPRSPMLFKINSGGTGLPKGCQQDIVHLVSSVATGVNSGNEWVIADGNAGARHTNFSNEITSLGELNWDAIDSHWWSNVIHHKQAEFLVADFFSWSDILSIGCYNINAANKINQILLSSNHRPEVMIKSGWYY